MSRIASKLVYNDLTGGINNVDSKELLNSTTRKTQTPDMMNVEYFKLGGIKTMEGNTEIGDKQPSAVIGGWEYIKNGTRYMIIGLRNGTVKIYNPTTEVFDTLFQFSHQSDKMSFCNMNNGVVITNGIDDLMFYEYGRHTSLKGAVSTTQGSTAVVGNSTQFTVELHSGDRIEINGVVYIVDTITDDTNLTLTTEASDTLSDVNYYLSTLSPCNATLINTDPDITDDPKPIRGLAIQFYNGRLWVGGKDGLFYSGVGLYNGWDVYANDAGVISEVYNDNSEVTALGLFSEYLMVHKELSSYVLTMTSDSESLMIRPYSNITCNSQQGWIVSNTKYFVYSRDFMDIYPLVQHTVFSDKFLGEPVSQKVRNIFVNVIKGEENNIFCVSRPKARQMIFYLPTVNQLGSGYGLIYDFQTKSWLLRVVPQYVTIAFNYNNNIYIGTDDGLVLREFSGRTFRQYDTEQDAVIDTPIISYYRSPWFDWASGYTQSFAEFMIEIDNGYENNFYIRTQKDGQSRFEDRNIVSEKMAGTSLIWDGIVPLDDNDTYWDEDVWIRGTFDNIRMLLPNNVFEDFQLEFRTDTLNQAFYIYEYSFRRLETEEDPW